MYSNTSGYVHMGLRLDRVRASGDNRPSASTHIPIPGPTLSVAGQGGGYNITHALLNLDPETLPKGGGVPPSRRRVLVSQGAPRLTDGGFPCSLDGRSNCPLSQRYGPAIIP